MPDQKPMWTRCLGGFSVMWVTNLLISPVKIRMFCPKRPNLAWNWHFWSFWARPCRLIQCPVGGSVGGCGARSVSRKTHIYFITMHKSGECMLLHAFVAHLELSQFMWFIQKILCQESCCLESFCFLWRWDPVQVMQDCIALHCIYCHNSAQSHLTFQCSTEHILWPKNIYVPRSNYIWIYVYCIQPPNF